MHIQAASWSSEVVSNFCFVCFNGHHLTYAGFSKKATMEISFFNCLHFYLTNLMQIAKNWKGIFCFTYKIYFMQCDWQMIIGHAVWIHLNTFKLIFVEICDVWDKTELPNVELLLRKSRLSMADAASEMGHEIFKTPS